nr:helitron helicase-like domain-containing protein [Tanacetum cinerariifolium]
VPSRWVKQIPIKVNVLAWKISMDRIPTWVNLHRRGVQGSIHGAVEPDNRPASSRPPSGYRSIGKCDHSCEHCGALFWYEERIKHSARYARPKYNRCCKGGRVALHTYQIYPDYIKLLLQDHHFLENIRAYNQMSSMTLLGACIDESINNRRGPTAREKLVATHVPNFKVRLYNVVGACEYELPTGDMLGAIVYEPGPETEMDYDIIHEERSGYPQRVKKLHPSYMSLQFPLLFYMARTAIRKTLSRLFQQYVVTAFCAIEQSRIDNIREHQNDIRNKYLSGIYDAINRGDSDGSDCGARIILPQSFTGGPRYITCARDEDIDVYVSAKLPSIDADLECHRIVSELMMHSPCELACPSASWTMTDLILLSLTLIAKKTTLTECLHYNVWNIDGRHLTYLNFPSEFVWNTNGKYWSHRRQRNKSSIGRLTVPSVKDLGRQSGMVEYKEAACSATLAELQTLFAHILMFCQVDDSELEDYVLCELEACLMFHSDATPEDATANTIFPSARKEYMIVSIKTFCLYLHGRRRRSTPVDCLCMR